MSAEHADYPRYLWDRQWWKYLDVLGGAKRKEVPNAAAVYDRLVQYAFAGEISWECVLQADSLDKAKRGLALLVERMAGELTTSEQLQGLLTSMNSAAEQEEATTKFREATGSAGQILENRALGRHGARPLPSGWQDVLTSVAEPRSGLERLLGAKNPRGGATRMRSWGDSLLGFGRASQAGAWLQLPCWRRRRLPCEDVVMERSAEQRVGRNEGIFREANEAIERGLWPAQEHARVRFRCECARVECNSAIELSLGDYERVRGNPRWFVMLSGHELSDVDVVVERRPGHVVVEKRGRAGEIAESEDPRS